MRPSGPFLADYLHNVGWNDRSVANGIFAYWSYAGFFSYIIAGIAYEIFHFKLVMGFGLLSSIVSYLLPWFWPRSMLVLQMSQVTFAFFFATFNLFFPALYRHVDAGYYARISALRSCGLLLGDVTGSLVGQGIWWLIPVNAPKWEGLLFLGSTLTCLAAGFFLVFLRIGSFASNSPASGIFHSKTDAPLPPPLPQSIGMRLKLSWSQWWDMLQSATVLYYLLTRITFLALYEVAMTFIFPLLLVVHLGSYSGLIDAVTRLLSAATVAVGTTFVFKQPIKQYLVSALYLLSALALGVIACSSALTGHFPIHPIVFEMAVCLGWFIFNAVFELGYALLLARFGAALHDCTTTPTHSVSIYAGQGVASLAIQSVLTFMLTLQHAPLFLSIPSKYAVLALVYAAICLVTVVYIIRQFIYTTRNPKRAIIDEDLGIEADYTTTERSLLVEPTSTVN